MAIVLASTTSSQADMDHAVSDNWREAPEAKPAPAPVPDPETVVEPEAPEAEPVEVPEEPEVPEAEEAKHKRGGVDKRIAKLTKETSVERSARVAAEARAEAAERELSQLRGESPARAPELEPKLEEYEAQGKTKDEWVRDTRIFARKMAELDQRGVQILKSGANKYSDWKALQQQIVENDISLPPDVNLAVNKVLWDEETENPEDIIHHLWANPEDGKKLAAMSPDAASRFVIRLGARLTAPAVNGNVESKPKPKVAPPAPITPITTSGTKTSIPLDKMDMKSFMRERNKQERDRRKGL